MSVQTSLGNRAHASAAALIVLACLGSTLLLPMGEAHHIAGHPYESYVQIFDGNWNYVSAGLSCTFSATYHLWGDVHEATCSGNSSRACVQTVAWAAVRPSLKVTTVAACGGLTASCTATAPGARNWGGTGEQCSGASPSGSASTASYTCKVKRYNTAGATSGEFSSATLSASAALFPADQHWLGACTFYEL